MGSQTGVPADDEPGIEIRAVGPDGAPADMSVLDENDIAHDPTKMHLDLTKAEKRRTTALMMAIQANKDLIIKDADYLREVHYLSRQDEGLKIRPATIDGIVDAAIKFDTFISGGYSRQTVEFEVTREPEPPAAEPEG